MHKTTRNIITAIILLLTIAISPTGCGPTERATLTEMMKVMPRETDSLFVIGAGILKTVPDIGEMWNTLTEQTLPAGAEPASLGMASRDGNLTGLCYTFDGDIPVYDDGTGEEIQVGTLPVTRTDNFWDSFTLENVLVVSVKDYTEETIIHHHEPSAVMYADFQEIIDQLPDGVFTAGVKNFTIAGKDTVLALSLDYGADKETPLTVTGVFKMDNGSVVALADFLERCGITDARIMKEGGFIKVSGKLKPEKFNTLMDRLTQSW